MTNFEKWWIKNKELYMLTGVTESIAKCIWNDAVESVEQSLIFKEY